MAGPRAAALAALALALVSLGGVCDAAAIWVINCGAITDKINRVVNPERTVQETVNLDDFAPAGPVTNTRAEKQGRFSKWRRGLTRTDSLIYRIPRIPRACHQMRLEWAEVTHCAAGERVFDIYVNGNRLYRDFDPYVKAGRRCKNAVLRIAKFPVFDGEIVVELRPTAASRQPPMLNYLRVYGLDVFDQPADCPVGGGGSPPTPSPSPRPTGPCAALGVITRKSVTDMSGTEWGNYVRAVNLLRTRSSNSQHNSRTLSIWDRYSQIHGQFAEHGSNQFLPWHREMLWRMDIELNRAVAGVRVPYLEWSSRSTNLFTSTMFSSTRYGGSGSGGAIPNGPFQGMTSNWDTPHAVSRDFADRNAIASRATVAGLIADTASSFDQWRATLEGIHGPFHINVGGDMSSLVLSTNDPLFYAHHAYIDKIWSDYEARGGRQFSSSTAFALRPWGTTSGVAISRRACVRYQAVANAARIVPPPTKDADPAGYQAAVDRAAAEKRDAQTAGRTFGMNEGDLAAANALLEDIMRAQGLEPSDATV